MLKNKGNYFILETKHTSLVMDTADGNVRYLYYGEKLADDAGLDLLSCGRDAAFGYEPLSAALFTGGIDFREPSLLIRFPDGSCASDFRLKSAEIAERTRPAGLPCSYGREQCVRFGFYDDVAKLEYVLQYTAYDDGDVISVTSFLRNEGDAPVEIERMASLQLEVWGDFSFTTFDGAWGSERQKHTRPLNYGKCENASYAGSSSHYRNPFVMLSDEHGCYGVNLVYSGNHRETAESDLSGRTRLLAGINPYSFSWELPAGECFFAPEAVMCFGRTEEQTSRRMHQFVQNHIVRGKWQSKERPILVNNWEGTYFSFTREKILAIAEKAKDIGAELFVLDDGWFGKRDDDTSSLGDWTDYTEKTGGIASLADEIRSMGLQFGIWVEPEMISEDSELYRRHPEYCMRTRREPTRMRNQLMLNLADPQVQEYVFRAVSDVIAETHAVYVKWDYNRYMTDCFDRQSRGGEYFHRYILGLYTILEKLTARYPDVLFEGCASGGGRFDLGILAYMPQIWTSDNTDARERIWIQEGTAAGYPQSTMGAHVSASPNAQTGNRNSLYARFCVACSGVLGYESDLTKAADAELEEMKRQTAFYKKYRSVLQFGDYHALHGDSWKGFLTCAADGSAAVAAVYVLEKRTGKRNLRVRFEGLDDKAHYRVFRWDRDGSLQPLGEAGGSLLNLGSFAPRGIFSKTDVLENSNPIRAQLYVFEKI